MTAPSNPYPTLPRGIDPNVVRSIRQASQATSTDFGLLMAQASQESSFRPDAKSPTSSATGLFQFVDSTWLDMVQRFGAKYGAGQLAQQITTDSSGHLSVSDPATRRKILDLRKDPALSASLAGEFDKQNQAQVEQALGHKAGRADLYMAHFLGAGGASAFLKAVETKGSTVAANLLPDAAAANPAVFYDSQTGHPRTVAEIYHAFATRIEKAATALGGADTTGGTNPVTALASASPTDIIANSPVAAYSGGRVDWSGVKLSDSLLSMLNVVALAALKMTSDDANAGIAERPTPRPTHDRRSI